MSMSQRSKLHHYVQEAYLTRFVNSSGLIWQYDRMTGEYKEVSPRVAGAEMYLYSPGVGADPKGDAIENALSEVDGHGIRVINALSEGQSLSEEQRHMFALYLAVQERRTPHFRDWMCLEVKRTAEMFLHLASMHPEYVRCSLEKFGMSVSDSAVQEMCKSVIAGNLEVQPTKVSWLNVLVSAGDLAPTIASLPWLVVEASMDIEFITCDKPLVKVLTDRNVPSDFCGGWLSPSSETTFALDPKHTLVIRPDGYEGRARAKQVWCNDVNSRTIRQARRFVFSKNREGFISIVSKRCNRSMER
jgi:hypothetical protein